jgi:ribose 5-phosphate isomerase B
VIVACSFDHAGVPLREAVFAEVQKAGHTVLDLGTDDPVTPDDYPDRALAVGLAIRDGKAERGVIVCGSGAGVSVAACKMHGIRAATVHDTYTAHQCVEHDRVNVICMGGRVIGVNVASEVVAAFVGATFSGEERHMRRLAKVDEIERLYGFGGSAVSDGGAV